MFPKIILSLFLAMLIASPLQAADLKLAFVDLQYCIQNSKEGKRSRTFLEKQAKSQGEGLKKKEQSLIQKSKALQNSLMMSPEQKQSKQQELMKLQQELRADMQKAQAKFNKDQQKHTQKIIGDLRTVVEQVAKKKKYDLVLERQMAQGILYQSFKIDNISKDVLKAYDKLN